MGRVLVPSTPEQENDRDMEVPVASDEDVSTVGTQETLVDGVGKPRQLGRLQSEESGTLPSSSPIRLPTTDLSEDGEAEGTAGEGARPPASMDSSPWWRAVGSLPRETGSPAFVQFDDNESRTFEEGELDEEDAPPSNQQQAPVQNARTNSQDLDAYMDSQANVSGQPPTPFSKANSSVASSPLWHGTENESYASREPRAASRADQDKHDESMRIDSFGEDEESSALLRTPPGPRTKTSRGARDGLCRALEDPPSRTFESARPEENSSFRGGYAPRQWDSEALGRNGRRRVPAVEDWGEEGDASENEVMFSPIPNTKAWEYRRGLRRMQDKAAEEDAEEERDAIWHPGRGEELSEHADPGTFSAQPREGSAARSVPARAASLACDDRNQSQGAGWQGQVSGDMQVDEHEDWRDVGMIPSAVAQGPGDEDAPALAENPRDRRWEVHFDDPERLVSGQSVDWQREMWGDSTVVMFAAYNYRYTTNGVVNRHVEGAVTAMTTSITGETRFNVVPPDPDQRKSLSARDLPFTWVIRGLTAAGASRMAAVRVASSRGVSIITYPRRLGNPKWVCSLVGFLRPDAGVIRAAVMNALQAPRMRERLEKMTSTNKTLRRIPPGERVPYILNTLEIRIADLDDGDFMANVYVEPPTDDMAIWREWVSDLRATRYNNFLNGSGVARRIFWQT
ncbi:hypothetical protein C8T65DRAFT_736912 [Cerioporus squamosus]|nr:hypothetical protein C8T65DRAFT_736912 [Cerioporus squamosus]